MDGFNKKNHLIPFHYYRKIQTIKKISMKRILVFIPLVILAACSSDKKNNNDSSDKKNITPQYQFATVQKGGISTTVKLPAQLAAYEEVSIFPKVNGYVKQVLVDIGSHVKQGQLLMTLEDPELIQVTTQAKEKYEKTKSDYLISKENYQRLSEAAQTPGAVSPLDISTAKSTTEATNSLSNAAKADWQMEQTMLSYLNITAPFTGVITARNVHPGALVSAANKNVPMLELKQESHLRLQVDIPEDIASYLKVDDSVTFFVPALHGKKMAGLVSRKSDNINPQYRTERIELDVMNNDGLLASGMYTDVVFTSTGNANGLSVPKSAVVTSTERKYVIVQRNNKLVKADVSTGNESTDKIEITGSLQAGDKVIINANDEIKTSDNE
jgi:membrane fusion protein (multidrug efflux system)